MYEQGINGINFVDSIISGTCSKNKYYESMYPQCGIVLKTFKEIRNNKLTKKKAGCRRRKLRQ